jgi:tRNA pseudouridine55 synthase
MKRDLMNTSLLFPSFSGMLLVDKPENRSSFSIVAQVRRITGQKKIGHAGTLDPFATGLLILLLSRTWTAKAGEFLHHDKEYQAIVRLGSSTDTYDTEGLVINTSAYIPTLLEVENVLQGFQGDISQIPPMFSAKKVAGTRLYDLARKGKEIERKPIFVHVDITLLEYTYPYLRLNVHCSKGTYIRALGNDIGNALGCYAHVEQLRRTKSGNFCIENALSVESLTQEIIQSHLIVL